MYYENDYEILLVIFMQGTRIKPISLTDSFMNLEFILS